MSLTVPLIVVVESSFSIAVLELSSSRSIQIHAALFQHDPLFSVQLTKYGSLKAGQASTFNSCEILLHQLELQDSAIYDEGILQALALFLYAP